jgi:hypothetical protein
MPEILQGPEPEERARKFSPVTFLIGAIVLVAFGVSIWSLLKPPAEERAVTFQQTVPLKMGPAEEQYGQYILIEKLALSRAENMAHQEVTTLAGEVANTGKQTVTGLLVTIEFHDNMNQNILRETRSVLGIRPTPLASGERRTFEIAFDNIPPSWNMQQPTLRIAHLQLAATK